MRVFRWEKKGLVFKPDIAGFTHGSHPCVLPIENDLYAVAFTCRDPKQRSHIFLSRAKIAKGCFELIGKPKLALAPGPLGHFDRDGVLSSSFLSLNGKNYLYYGGWENMVSVPFTANTGRLIFDAAAMSLEREFPCPVLGRDPQSPIFSGAPCFVKIGDEVWGWYTSACRWEQKGSDFKHYYSIRRAVSKDGIVWASDPELAIPFVDEHEYAVARSSVMMIEGEYCMWFAHRGTKSIPTYRIGFATSKDGLKWDRKDSLAGIDVSPTGWDSQMIGYPHVFENDGWLYMLYNGNDYGKTGFGYAVSKL